MKQSSHFVFNTQFMSKNGLEFIRDCNKNGNIFCLCQSNGLFCQIFCDSLFFYYFEPRIYNFETISENIREYLTLFML